MIPLLATVGWSDSKHGKHLVWIPLFLVWLVLLPLGAVLFPLMFVVGLGVRVNALRLYGVGWQILSSLRKMVIEVEDAEATFVLSVR
jgi:hypothetical protein